MVDIEPGLDSKLRAFFEHIEASNPSSGLTNIDVAMPDRRRRSVFNLFAGIAAAALVAASVTVFAIELRTHGNPAPGPAVRSASPSPSPLRAMPLLGEGGVPTAAHVVVPTLRGRGSRQLEMFVPQGTLYIQFDCAGPGHFQIASTNRVIGNDLQQCSSSFGVTTLTVDGPKAYDDKPMTLQVTADPGMIWELYVAQSRPLLPAFSARADETVLVPATYGTGSATLPAFSVGPGETLYVRDACNSGGAADTLEMVGGSLVGDLTQDRCSDPNGVSGGSGSPCFGSCRPGGPITVHVKADSSISWEIQIVEGPDFLVSAPGDVPLAPVAFGMGSMTLPAFTPTQAYTVEVACSGAGTLTIGSPGFTHTATPNCVGRTDSFTPAGQIPGNPVSLSVDAPPGMGWSILIYQVEPSSNHLVCHVSHRTDGSTSTSCALNG